MSVTTGTTGDAAATIAGFVATFELDQLPEAARKTATRAFLDCAGVALAGSAQPAGRIAADTARSLGRGDTSVWGHGFTSSPTVAALVNGTAAHALDYDDVSWALIGHPSVSLVPAVLALAESCGADGKAVLAAYACGFEVMAHIGRACMPAHSYTGGWHATGTIGTIGVAAACAHLLRLSHAEVVNAVGVAVSHASGVVQNFGSMSKPLHAGLAAQGGIQAALLARGGFTARDDAMDGKHGFFASFNRDLEVNRERLDRLGATFELADSGLVVKPYPCGVAGHPAIDAALHLRDQLRADADASATIERVDVFATSYTLDKMRYSWPNDGLQAKFSLPYQVARAILHGPPGLDAFQDTALDDVPVRELAARVHLSGDEEIEATWRSRGGSRPCRVVAQLSDGRERGVLVETSKGNPEVPMTDEELLGKFHDCARLVLPTDQREQLAATLLGLDQLSDVRHLCTLLRGPSTVEAG